MIMPAETIDQVIEQLDDIIDWSINRNSRMGYFTAKDLISNLRIHLSCLNNNELTGK